MDILGWWGDGSQECCSMHLRLQFVGPHMRPRSHFLKGSTRKGGNSLSISWNAMYFSWSQCTSTQEHTRSADRRCSVGTHLLGCSPRAVHWGIEVMRCAARQACLTKICLYPVLFFLSDKFMYYFPALAWGNDTRIIFCKVWSESLSKLLSL